MSEKMIFCLGDGGGSTVGEGYQKNHRIFNMDVSKEEYGKAINSHPSFELPIAKWIDKKDMTEEEKQLKPSWEQTGGYLKVLSYEDAWKEGWANASEDFKNWVKNLPHFNAEIFKGITGLDISSNSLKGKKVEVKIDGESYTATLD